MSEPLTYPERAIEIWRRPFQASVIYDREDIEELEDHLRSHVADALSEGNDLASAFEMSLPLVGTEQELRPEYMSIWLDRPSPVRWWRAIKAEGSFSSHSKWYRFSRILSLGVGAFGLLVPLSVSLAWLTIPHVPDLSFDVSKYLHVQNGHVFALTMSLTALFNLTPFKFWANSPLERVRPVLALCAGLIALHTAVLGIGAIPTDMFMDNLEPFLWSGIVLIGPALWWIQLRWRMTDLAMEMPSSAY